MHPLSSARQATSSPPSLGKRLQTLMSRHPRLIRAFTLIGSYVVWIAVFRLLVLTFITYFVMQGSTHPMDSHDWSETPRKFEEVSDAFSAAEVEIAGISAFFFILLIRFLNPLGIEPASRSSIAERLEKKFLPGFIQGALLACSLAVAFLLAGAHRYLGFLVQFEGIALALTNVFFRTLGICLLVASEELIFRKKLLQGLEGSPENPELPLAIAVSLGFCGIKALQFDLGWMHLLTLFLASLSLSLRSFLGKDFIRGAGYWTGILLIFHPLLSLPIFGNDFSGIALVKYQFQPQLAGAPAGDESTWIRILTGGAGGPLSSLALQLLLLLDLVRGMRRYKIAQ